MSTILNHIVLVPCLYKHFHLKPKGYSANEASKVCQISKKRNDCYSVTLVCSNKNI